MGPLNVVLFSEWDKVVELNGCNICTYGIKILSDVEVLHFDKCIVDLCEEEAFMSRFIPASRNIFSSLSLIHIYV